MGLSALAAGAGSLLFAVHPMHVESVAWVTERKDVLYAFFYVLALHQYCRYLQAGAGDAAFCLFGCLRLFKHPGQAYGP